MKDARQIATMLIATVLSGVAVCLAGFVIEPVVTPVGKMVSHLPEPLFSIGALVIFALMVGIAVVVLFGTFFGITWVLERR